MSLSEVICFDFNYFENLIVVVVVVVVVFFENFLIWLNFYNLGIIQTCSSSSFQKHAPMLGDSRLNKVIHILILHFSWAYQIQSNILEAKCLVAKEMIESLQTVMDEYVSYLFFL